MTSCCIVWAMTFTDEHRIGLKPLMRRM